VYPAHDLLMVGHIPEVRVPPDAIGGILEEVAAVTAWHDDFPFYSDGSWSAVSLRGFRPDDPQWGIKPAEMPRAWREQHPEALDYACDWTTLAQRTPALRQLVEGVTWWGGLERVRLLRMAGRGGRGGVLARHTDVTDKAAGTRDGQVVRFHVPLVTDPRIVMHTWELDGTRLVTHLPAWSCWYLDARKPHAVLNPTGTDRVHLVVDVVADAAVREHLGEATG
jgi:Aspartyl/Asparaginyl beta-hydroxylase